VASNDWGVPLRSIWKVSRARVVVVGVMVAALVLGVAGIATGRVRPHRQTVPGFDGKTIKVSGLVSAANFFDSPIGAEARFKAANDNHELGKGIKIEYGDTADDKFDVATSISEARRLVEQEGVFAIVPMVTATGPGDYMNQKKVPYFGWGFDKSYCGTGDKLYGFGFSGCVLPTDPKKVPDFSAGNPYKLLKSMGIKKPTIAAIGTDSAPGHASMKSFIAQATGSGLKVVWAKAILPAPPAVTGDYTPYVQQILASNKGKGPDMVFLAAGVNDGLAMPDALRNAGYKGLTMTSYYSDALLKGLKDTYIATSFAPYEQHTKGGDEMVAQIKAFKPDAKPSSTMAAGYFAADFFVKAIKKLGVKNLTREKLQKTAAHMTYSIPETVGPTQYPKAFQALNSYCAGTVYDDGTQFTVAEPFSCTNHFTSTKGLPSEVG
jgi:ABC-type branched-subunit amino acid transport system substrate-binding protein